MERRALNDKEVQEALADLAGWEVMDGKLTKKFKFKSFAQALGWMVSAGIYADKIDHHPEWKNVYNRVEVQLVTHDLGNAISTWDIDLAKRMDELVKV
jgi:4a-hydroxytetrahydrobiopterin dehydratase